MSRLTGARRSRRVVIEVDRGLINVIHVPRGVEVVVKDYDVTLGEPDPDRPYRRDPSGREFARTIWSYGGGAIVGVEG